MFESVSGSGAVSAQELKKEKKAAWITAQLQRAQRWSSEPPLSDTA